MWGTRERLAFAGARVRLVAEGARVAHRASQLRSSPRLRVSVLAVLSGSSALSRIVSSPEIGRRGRNDVWTRPLGGDRGASSDTGLRSGERRGEGGRRPRGNVGNA